MSAPDNVIAFGSLVLSEEEVAERLDLTVVGFRAFREHSLRLDHSRLWGPDEVAHEGDHPRGSVHRRDWSIWLERMRRAEGEDYLEAEALKAAQERTARYRYGLTPIPQNEKRALPEERPRIL